MDVIVCMHMIPSINTLTEVKANVQVQLELDMYFEPFMNTTTSVDLQMSTDTMHKYGVCPTTPKTMLHTLHDKLDRDAK